MCKVISASKFRELLLHVTFLIVNIKLYLCDRGCIAHLVANILTH